MNSDELRDAIARDAGTPGLADVRDILGLPSDTPLTPVAVVMREDANSEMKIQPPPKSVQEIHQSLSLKQKLEVLWTFRYMSARAAMDARFSYSPKVSFDVQEVLK